MSTPATATKAQNPPSLGFEIIENMLHEFRGSGRSPSLERVVNAAVQGLERYGTDNPSPQAKKDAAAVRQALEESRQLVLDIVEEAKGK